MSEMARPSGKTGDGIAGGTREVSRSFPATEELSGSPAKMTMERVLRSENLKKAYARVKSNSGAPGVDGMTVEALGSYLVHHWEGLREQLREGSYRPSPVRLVEIPKPDGRGKRRLGIPTVLDRLIQQSVLQVLQPVLDAEFSESSFGFRPGRSAHQALRLAQSHARAGHRMVVNLDLENFFDRVHHDILMSLLARKIEDRGLLKLIRLYLQAGVLSDGVVSPRVEGTPQGGPLSPFLSNVLLDVLDRELESRGHRFVRYADDCNVYVRSRRAGERVLASLRRFLWQRLRLVLNESKSTVDGVWKCSFLGYSMTVERKARLRVSPRSVRRLRQKIRDHLRRGRGRSLWRTLETLAPVLKGWLQYFRLNEVKGPLESLDQWLRRRMRVLLWRHWKRPRTRVRELMRRGIAKERAWICAYNGHGPWWNSRSSHMHQAVPAQWLEQRGLLSLIREHRRLANLT